MAAADARPDPSARQRAASDPAASVWVSASAGSGKTKVLTDRVLSLLLAGTPPERILCLTFTRAAAAEMSNRINRQLSGWATGDDDRLTGSLAELTGRAPDEDTCRRARRLFARVLDTPGGLKIQTIHAFCQSLLGRFPVEAGLAPHFQVLDERSAAELVDAARDRVLLRSGDDAALRDALETVSEHIDERRFSELMAVLGTERHRLERFVEQAGGLDGATAAIRDRLGVRPGETRDSLLAEASHDSAFDRTALTDTARIMIEGSGKTDPNRGRIIADWLALPVAGRAAGFDDYATAYLKQDGEPYATPATKGLIAGHPEIEGVLVREAERVRAMLDRRRALVTAEATAALLRLGHALLQEYVAAKRALARLDYDDLILITERLFRKPDIAPWILFKLDGGIDHILIDEAQDTSPQQWAVVARLAEEFFAGEGAREVARTVFAVGDTKQSIFSFQHADPEEFRRMRAHFAERVEAGGGTWRPVELDVSFRSTAAVLDAVDRVFAQPAAAAGVVEPGQNLRHFAWREGHAGRVELWPAVAPRDREKETPWSPPLTRRAGDDPKGRLALVLAAEIAGWIGKETLESRGRPVRAGDIMVLVRSRTGFVEALVRALKDLGVPVSGVDRMVLSEQIAVMDLIALGRFLLLPGDDLTLATVLKCPLVGLDDDDLFRLAHGRGSASLWRRLGEEAVAEPRYAAARDWLTDLLAQVDLVRPYELYAGILAQPAPGGGNGRQRMLARLGPDAEDPIDEFLGLAFAHERGHASALEGFLHWVEAGEAEVKRDLEQSGRDEVRVMTVHGSKGLQAPIVVLPDTMSKPRVAPALLWDGNMPLWPPRSAWRDTVCESLLAATRQRTDEEYRRLLYVAMTRAEDRLYVCGAEGQKRPPEDCWYELVRQGLDIADGETVERREYRFGSPRGQGWTGEGLLLRSAQNVPAEPDDRAATAGADVVTAEPWMLRDPPPEPTPPRPLAPSRPTMDEPPVRSPLGADSTRRFRRGVLIHRLLELLPDLAPAQRATAAAQFLARPLHGLDDAAQDEIAREVMRVLEDPAFGPIFAPGSRAEVPVAGLVEGPDGPMPISGQLDRLAITDRHVLVVDYKSNRPPPERPEDVPALYWRQMAAYRALIRKIYENHEVRCALLWTDGPFLMELDGPRLDRALRRP